MATLGTMLIATLLEVDLTAGDIAALVTAVALAVTAVTGIVTALQVRRVHRLVNSNNSALIAEQRRLNNRVGQLLTTLGEADIPAPDQPSDAAPG